MREPKWGRREIPLIRFLQDIFSGTYPSSLRPALPATRCACSSRRNMVALVLNDGVKDFMHESRRSFQHLQKALARDDKQARQAETSIVVDACLKKLRERAFIHRPWTRHAAVNESAGSHQTTPSSFQSRGTEYISRAVLEYTLPPCCYYALGLCSAIARV